MGKGRKFQKTHLTRPKKSEGARRRRQKDQKRRLVGLGMEESVVDAMNPREVRTLRKRPAKVAEGCAAAPE